MSTKEKKYLYMWVLVFAVASSYAFGVTVGRKHERVIIKWIERTY